MRLLYTGTDGKFSLTKDLYGDSDIPAYAILSHTWQEGEEVTFDDLTNGTGGNKAGYTKIRFCAQQAERDGLHYFWVDTCCINKLDPIELQTAINSMFRWYRDAAKCYVFLSDVSINKRKAGGEASQFPWEPAFRASRWHTRGWCLQELLAPRIVRFFSRECQSLGDKRELKQQLHDITGIPISALVGEPLTDFEVEVRLSWSKKRNTSREEDKAYSLLGIFGIFMPLIYGEGHDHAFLRLRKVINESLENSRPLEQTAQFPELHLECLRSLAFPEQEYRYDSIHTASNTCEWLLEDPLYQTWLANTGGLFWIKGNPGVGKSVLMKFAVETMHKRKTTEIVLSFFIHGQGTNLQKTPLGVFRALLNCLLSEFPQQLTKLSTIFEERENRFGGYAADRWGWKEEELKKILVDVLTVGLPRRAILIFVDALDECGEEPAKILLELFKEIAKQAVQGSQVKICFSSRHYPILGLDTIPTIRVEDHNDKDIQCYARERLQDIQPGLKRQQIEAEILSKARGGFQWVYLVTDIINRGILAGIRADKVLDELTSCPETLGELYATILSGIPKTEKYEMVKLFRWVLFSGRPLSAQELREALATDPKMDCKSISELRSHKSWSDTLSDFERHVKHISRGLVEFQTRDLWEQYEPDAENSDREAQFIHQSVADYLVDEFLDHSTQHESNFRSQRGAGHFQISRSCLRYLTMPEVLGGACLSPGKLFSNFPLLPYAARYLLEHIQKLEKEGFVQSDLLLAIQWAPHSDTMKRLAELWKLMDADFAHIPLGWPFIGATKLHVLVALGSKSAVDLLLECADEEVDGKDKNGNTPLMLAIRENHEDIALMLLDRFADCQPHVINEGRLIKINTQNNDDDTALNIALEEKSGAIVFKLIEVGADLEYLGREHILLAFAISSEDMKLLEKLIEKKVNLDGSVFFALKISRANLGLRLQPFVEKLLKAGASMRRANHFDWDYRCGIVVEDDEYDEYDEEEEAEEDDDDALMIASRRGLTNWVDMLLSHGASAIHRNAKGEWPLWAARTEDVMRSLLQHAPESVEMQSYDDDYDSIFSLADDVWGFDITACLLNEGRFSNPSRCLGNFLHKIIKNLDARGSDSLDLELVEIILERKCALLSVSDETERTLLWLASYQGNAGIVELLLETKQFNINWSDKSTGMTALSCAADAGHKEVVQVLLGADGVDINAKSETGDTPLLYAVRRGRKEIVGLLLGTEGVDVNATSYEGDSPLLYAVKQGYTEVVELLLRKKGVNINTKSHTGDTPLGWAARIGNKEIVQLLLESCTTANEKPQGFTPLHQAIHDNGTFVVDHILDYFLINDGVNSLITLAMSRTHVGIGKLLLEHSSFDIDQCVLSSHELLVWAINRRSKDTVKHLLSNHHINVNKEDNKGYTPLSYAIRAGDYEVLNLLLNKDNIDVNWRDFEGRTLLIDAVVQRRSDFVKAFLHTGKAEVDAKESDGTTALMWAVHGDDEQIVKILLEVGNANIHMMDHHGQTPIGLAKEKRYDLRYSAKHYLRHHNVKLIYDRLLKANEDAEKQLYALDQHALSPTRFLREMPSHQSTS